MLKYLSDKQEIVSLKIFGDKIILEYFIVSEVQSSLKISPVFGHVSTDEEFYISKKDNEIYCLNELVGEQLSNRLFFESEIDAVAFINEIKDGIY